MKRDAIKQESKKTGRPRAFDETSALNKAMLAFWRHGFESTSMSELSAEMGMSAPSIYATFGDKKSLFLKALDLYVGDLEMIDSFLDQAPSAYEATHELLKASVIRFTSTQTPRGCMLASATASCSAESSDVQAEAAKKRASIEKLLTSRIAKDVALKILPKTISPDSLSTFTIVVIQGLSVLARDGAPRKKLFSVVDAAMKSWPKP